MNASHRIKAVSHPPLRRRRDRVRAINTAIEQMERITAQRHYRMQLVLGAAAMLLIVNAVVVVALA